MTEPELRELYVIADCLGKGLHKLAFELTGRVHFPYGYWIYRDGREILFDRGYNPLWQYHDGRVKVVDQEKFVHGGQRQQVVLFNDGKVDWYLQYDAMKRLRSILVGWSLIRQTKRERGADWRAFKARRSAVR